MGALDGADYEVLKSLDTGTVNIFQEKHIMKVVMGEPIQKAQKRLFKKG